jgi:hypothetical protein
MGCEITLVDYPQVQLLRPELPVDPIDALAIFG